MAAPTLHDFLRELDETRTYYRLTSVRDGAVMVEVALPDERWEIEFFDDREPEIEVYRSDGQIFGPEKLSVLRGMIGD
ncbi:MAG TPA: hypothetical protein VHS33_05770 [Sphingomicrobium sp.]|jgi:hypothetical protein|nr:hypothetical protein [Sphingomicrobium sp.]